LRYTILNNTKYALSDISAAAKDRGFELGNYNWPKPVHLIYPYNKIISYNRKDLKISEYLSSHLINLPVHYYVDEMDITEIVKVLNRF
jgi:dTDP-4-amino-4,6-dideoxygalactose transaminase